MTEFKDTQNYTFYNDNSKGKIIVQNIEETKSNPRSIENSFNIEYILYPLNVQTIIGKLNEKEKEESLKIIFEDYSKIKEKLLNNNIKTGDNIVSKKIDYLKDLKNALSNIKLSINKDENTFQFYTNNGFIYFMTQFDQFIKDENINIKKVIYIDSLNSQISNLINKCFNKEEDKKKEEVIDSDDTYKENIEFPKINNIISFPSFDFDKERKNDNKNDVNQLMQYYLFLADYLEKAKNVESSLKYLLDNISKQSLNKKENK